MTTPDINALREQLGIKNLEAKKLKGNKPKEAVLKDGSVDLNAIRDKVRKGK